MTNYNKYYKGKYHKNRNKTVRFLGGKCSVCESTERLEFDHIKNDRKDRRHCLSQMFLKDWDTIILELEKCQLLCRKCHARKSIIERGWGTPKHGTLTRYIKLNCRCEQCKLSGKIYNRKRYELRMGYQ